MIYPTITYLSFKNYDTFFTWIWLIGIFSNVPAGELRTSDFFWVFAIHVRDSYIVFGVFEFMYWIGTAVALDMHFTFHIFLFFSVFKFKYFILHQINFFYPKKSSIFKPKRVTIFYNASMNFRIE